MFPLRDNIPSRHRPYMVWAILAVNILVFVLMLPLGPGQENGVFHLFGVVPARFFHPDWAVWRGYPEGGSIAFLAHMFLHSGWLHIIANMWSLWIFGDNVEDVMGPVRFLIFYVLCGLAALGVHMVTASDSTVPVVGASGAIGGVMGAYFFLYPHARVVTVVPILIFPLIFEIPALFFLGAWFMSQVFSGLLTSSAGGGVAWWAHIGGFVAGMLLLRFFRDDARCHYCYRSETWKGWEK
ncbi:MAG: rhomboid family intramembrane serine protease [Deltaproteobacteria bacterium]|nr:rhomboid family intramembrane serine protease [Deltaproteobacteria bacterium]